jgi:hypothetical protein
MTERRNNMNYAVVNPTTKRVENIISADSSVIETVQNASGMLMIPAEGVPLQISDTFDPDTGLFFRDGTEVLCIPTVSEMIQNMIDAYTKELIEGGIL